MTLTIDAGFLDNLYGLSEEEMAERIPSHVYIARAVLQPNGKFQAVYAAPGLLPRVAAAPDGRPYEYNTEIEAEAGATRSLHGVLNKPRIKAHQSGGKPERYKKISGPEFAVLLARVEITPSFFAYLMGTTQQRVLNWIDGVEDPSHPARILLEIFAAHPEAIDIAERVTNQVTTKRQSRKDET